MRLLAFSAPYQVRFCILCVCLWRKLEEAVVSATAAAQNKYDPDDGISVIAGISKTKTAISATAAE